MSQSNIFLDRDIVVFGAQDHAVVQLPKLNRLITATHIYPDGEMKVSAPNLVKLDTIEAIQSLRNPFVIICRASSMSQILGQISTELTQLNIEFDHIDHLITGAVISTELLKKMKKRSHIDPNGNVVRISEDVSDKFWINFRRNGGKNVVTLDSTHIADRVKINFYGSEGKIDVGSGTSFVSTVIEAGHLGSVRIGKDCMFSHGIELGQTDQHPFFDLATGKRLNYGKSISIGNHVWVGRNVNILGGADIADGSIVGAGSITSSKFGKNVLIAGSPARVLREGVLWARDSLTSEPIDHITQCNDKQGLYWALENHPVA
jgi:acetyltransferase-like isoleucine patch superfamily enzyme